MRRALLPTFLFVSFLAVSCGRSEKNDPRKVADRFTVAVFVDADIDAARKYVSSDLLDEFPAPEDLTELGKSLFETFREHARSHGYQYEYDAPRSKTDGNQATMRYKLTAKGNPGWKGEGEVELEKDGRGKWVVTDYEFDRDDESFRMDL